MVAGETLLSNRAETANLRHLRFNAKADAHADRTRRPLLPAVLSGMRGNRSRRRA